MDILFLIKAAILGLVEGITEFLPISSTAHLIIVGDWIHFVQNQSSAVFEIVIQLGAILAVICIYRQRLWQTIVGFFTGDRQALLFVRNLLIAFLPAAIVGLLLIKYIERLLDGMFGVYAFTLIVGGVIMLWVEKHPTMSKASQIVDENAPPGQGLDDITWKQALVVGCAQCLAMIPGTSRSGATIISGMMAGIPRRASTEFSFFLAIPVMIAASVLSLYKHGSELDPSYLWAVVVGFVMAFLSALVLIKALLRFVSKRSYVPFAWYRIALGIVVVILILVR